MYDVAVVGQGPAGGMAAARTLDEIPGSMKSLARLLVSVYQIRAERPRVEL